MEEMIVDLDSTDDTVYGNQVGAAYNAYYKDKIFHSLFCFDRCDRGLCKVQV